MKRILVIINKWWECDPIMNVLLHDEARPKNSIKWPRVLNYPHARPSSPLNAINPVPRAIFSDNSYAIEVWCISDLLEDYADNGRWQSSAELKNNRMHHVFGGPNPSLVIAMGTAGFPSENSENGSVVAGTNIFMHDCHANGENPDSKWNSGPFEKLFRSRLPTESFSRITDLNSDVADLFMIAPLNPSPSARLIASHDYVALGSVNVTDYSEYEAADAESWDAYVKLDNRFPAMSLETTHGLIRAQSEAPFMFISGITDRVGHFKDEVGPRQYAQNSAAAHNAGIILAWMFPKIIETI